MWVCCVQNMPLRTFHSCHTGVTFLTPLLTLSTLPPLAQTKSDTKIKFKLNVVLWVMLCD